MGRKGEEWKKTLILQDVVFTDCGQEKRHKKCRSKCRSKHKILGR